MDSAASGAPRPMPHSALSSAPQRPTALRCSMFCASCLPQTFPSSYRSDRSEQLLTKGMLTLHFLPGYAPELNPDELVWSHMKRTGVARAPLRRGERLQAKIEAQLGAIKRMPQLIRSFFKAPSVSYITDWCNRSPGPEHCVSSFSLCCRNCLYRTGERRRLQRRVLLRSNR